MYKFITTVFFLIGLLLNSSLIAAQEIITKDSIRVEFKKSKKASKFFNVRQSNKVKSDKLKKILVRCKVKSLKGEPVDINAFSLLDTINKIRYRVADYLGYKAISIGGSGISSEKYIKTELLDKKGRPWASCPPYDPSVKDTFEDYNFSGYQNFEVPVNFSGFKSRPKISVVYYSPTSLKSFTADLFFVILRALENKSLTLYYKREKIVEIQSILNN